MAINNPVDSFMRGFAVVDQLETNRQLRSFREEEMSQARKEWAHQDEEWAREANQRRQAKYAAAFESTTVSVMEEVDMQVQEQLRLADEADAAGRHDEAKKRRKHADEAIKYWTSPNPVIDGKPAGEAMIVQEVVRRMMLADPEFGEFVMLKAKRDPAAGSLVDSRKPVQSLILLPPELSPTGELSIAAELNRKDGGTGGMTQFRTDRPNDPIDFVPVNASLAHEVFGTAYATGNSASLRLLRNTLEEPAGTTARTDPSRPVTGASAEQAAGTTTGQEAAAGGGKEQTGGEQTIATGEETYNRYQSRGDESELEQPQTWQGQSHFQPPPGREDVVPGGSDMGTRTGAQGDRGPAIDTRPTPSTAGQGMNPAYEPLPPTKFGETVKEALSPATEAAGRALERGKEAFDMIGGPEAVENVKGLGRHFNIEGIKRELTGQRQGTVMDSPVVQAIGHLTYGPNWKSSPAEADVSPSEINAAAQGDQAKQEKISAPSDDRQVMQAAQVVTQPVRGRRPSWLQQYSAIGLKNLGVINEEQLMRYAKTSSFDEAARWRVENLGTGQLFYWREDLGPASGQLYEAPLSQRAMLEAAGEQSAERLKQAEAIRDSIRQQIEDNPQNWFQKDGKGQFIYNRRNAGTLLNIIEEYYKALGIPQWDDRRTTDVELNYLAKGLEMVRDYDESDLPGINWNPWNDNNLEETAFNVAVARHLAPLNYSKAENTTALDDYIKSLTPQVRSILGMQNTLQSLRFTQAMELEVLRALGGDSVGPYGRTYKGNKHDIRQQLLSDYIKFKSEEGG
jgi:hypothetical protein